MEKHGFLSGKLRKIESTEARYTGISNGNVIAKAKQRLACRFPFSLNWPSNVGLGIGSDLHGWDESTAYLLLPDLD
jgi:hypothetical protein